VEHVEPLRAGSGLIRCLAGRLEGWSRGLKTGSGRLDEARSGWLDEAWSGGLKTRRGELRPAWSLLLATDDQTWGVVSQASAG
jgi:hypothetical protein